mmetsp:Transcript_28533/g.59790  ORF Transcript_28533/g.59790 Transcript_28533/m.59790 type:complete len:186 (+) Transcript_28533:226-783(+)
MCCGLSAVEVLPGALSNVPILQCVKPRVKSRHQHGKLLRAQLRISVYIGTCMCKVNAVGSSIGPDVSQPLPQLVFVHSAITVDVESSWARLVRAQFATAPSKVAVSYGHLLLKFSCDQILHVFRKVGAKRGKVRLHGMACRSKVDLRTHKKNHAGKTVKLRTGALTACSSLATAPCQACSLAHGK